MKRSMPLLSVIRVQRRRIVPPISELPRHKYILYDRCHFHRIISFGWVKYSFRAPMNSAAVASSTTLRSALNLAVMIVAIAGLPFSPVAASTLPGTTLLSPPPTANIAPWGGLTTALNSVPPRNDVPRRRHHYRRLFGVFCALGTGGGDRQSGEKNSSS